MICALTPVAHRGASSLRAVVRSFATCAAILALARGGGAQVAAADGDPAHGVVALPAQNGWVADLVWDAGVGVWTVASAQVHPHLGCPEILAMDDRGRCTVLRSYSGKWTPEPTITDGQWLAPVACCDVDPRWPGVEVYTGGQGGRLWQLSPHPDGRFDARIVASWPGEEIHTLLAGDLDPVREGRELLVFLMSGRTAVVRVDDGEPRAIEIQSSDGRVRQAELLRPAAANATTGGDVGPWIVTAARSGVVGLARWQGDGLERREVCREAMGCGRVAIGRPGPGGDVFYVSRDDGIVLRFEGTPELGFERQIIHIGQQGLRGVVAGRFHADPAREAIAVFGYSGKVELVSRATDGRWSAQTLFVDNDRGHWLATAELDGRNGTDEILASGYGGRVVLLRRPPGYGMASAASDQWALTPEAEPARSPSATPAVRVGLHARAGSAEHLSPLRYTGGFLTKAMIYETLVTADGAGRLQPGLAASWSVSDDGLEWRFTLREGARFHDGSAVTADAVAVHFRRWVGLPEHDWLPCNRRIQSVRAVDVRTVVVRTDRPWALPPELCATNPCAIVGPAARNREGEFVAAVGTGPWRMGPADDDGLGWRVERVADERGTRALALRVFPRQTWAEPIAALRAGALDVFVGGWDSYLTVAELDGLADETDLRVATAPGSSVIGLHFRFEGPTARLDLRRALAASISREALIDAAEPGTSRLSAATRGEACSAWAAPAVEAWPRVAASMGGLPATAGPVAPPGAPPLTLRRGGGPRLDAVVQALAAQLRSRGWDIELTAGDADLFVTASHGVPYDPHVTLVRAFGSASARAKGLPPELRDAVDAAAAAVEPAARSAAHAEVQALLDRTAAFVPLYVPRRFALVRRGIDGLRLDANLYQVDWRGIAPGRQAH